MKESEELYIKTIIQRLVNFLQKTVFTNGNLQESFIEIFKVKINLAPEILIKVFDVAEYPYSHRNKLRFKSQNIRTIWYGI